MRRIAGVAYCMGNETLVIVVEQTHQSLKLLVERLPEMHFYATAMYKYAPIGITREVPTEYSVSAIEKSCAYPKTPVV